MIKVMNSIRPIFIDFRNLRREKQILTNKYVVDAIQSKNKEKLYQYSNSKELERVLEEIQMSLDSLLEYCATQDIATIILAGRISINASRQSTKLEKEQIQVCKDTASKFGIDIIQLTTTAFRATKTGEIITGKNMKKTGIKKDACMKSFDGQITGKMKGWIFAKMVYGSGGHQDSVFEEADYLCKWIEDFHKEDEDMYVLLIDTDLQEKYKTLENKYQDVKNIMITNHILFQQYIIDHYELI